MRKKEIDKLIAEDLHAPEKRKFYVELRTNFGVWRGNVDAYDERNAREIARGKLMGRLMRRRKSFALITKSEVAQEI